MAISMYSGFVPVCLQLLGGLKNVLQKAEAHATEQKWDTGVVLNLRLFPDMFPLERQVRQVCNHALGAGRVAGVDLPSLPDADNSFAEIQSRIDKTVDFLKGLKANQLDGKDDSEVTVTVGGQPRQFKAQNYLYHFAIPRSAPAKTSHPSWSPREWATYRVRASDTTASATRRSSCSWISEPTYTRRATQGKQRCTARQPAA